MDDVVAFWLASISEKIWADSVDLDACDWLTICFKSNVGASLTNSNFVKGEETNFGSGYGEYITCWMVYILSAKILLFKL